MGLRFSSELTTICDHHQRHDRLVHSKLEPAVAAKVRELLAAQEPIDGTNGDHTSRSRGMKTRAAGLLDPPQVSQSSALLSPLIRQGRTAISTLNEAEVDKIRVPF